MALGATCFPCLPPISSLQPLDGVLLAPQRPGVAAEASLAAALAQGAALAAEQQSVLDVRLSLEYMKGLEADLLEAEERQERWRRAAAAKEARRLAEAEAAEAVRRAAAEELLAAAAAARAAAAEKRAARGEPEPAAEQWQEEEEEQHQKAAPLPTPSGLPGMTPDELAAALRIRSAVVLDVRAAREWDWGRIKGAVHCPYIIAAGSSLSPQTRPCPDFLGAARRQLGDPASAPPAVLYGPGSDLDAATNEKFVSKEKFVSVAPSGLGTIDGEVRCREQRQGLLLLGGCFLSTLATAQMPRLALIHLLPCCTHRTLWRQQHGRCKGQGTLCCLSWRVGTAPGTWRTAPMEESAPGGPSETSLQVGRRIGRHADCFLLAAHGCGACSRPWDARAPSRLRDPCRVRLPMPSIAGDLEW